MAGNKKMFMALIPAVFDSFARVFDLKDSTVWRVRCYGNVVLKSADKIPRDERTESVSLCSSKLVSKRTDMCLHGGARNVTPVPMELMLNVCGGEVG
jgi:hypothetical protein